MPELLVRAIPVLVRVIRTEHNTKQTHVLSPFVKSSDLGLKL